MTQSKRVARGDVVQVFIGVLFVSSIWCLSLGVQAAEPGSEGQAPTNPSGSPQITANASKLPRMSTETRTEIIRDFGTQIVYARTTFPMGSTGLKLKHGVITPSGPALQNMLAVSGPSIKPGDPAQISFIRIEENHIHFELNGGAIHRKRWYQHIQVSGANGTPVPLSKNEEAQNPHGSCLDLYFDKYVPEMTAAQLRDMLDPVFDFSAHNKEEAYLNSVPLNAKQAIEAHHVLVGMDTDMVIHAMGKPPKKVREQNGDVEYEDWIYGEPPQDVEFVRILGDEVVRIEIMKVGGEKIVRTDREITVPKANKDEPVSGQDDKHHSRVPTLRRPGEDAEQVPKPAEGNSPIPSKPE